MKTIFTFFLLPVLSFGQTIQTVDLQKDTREKDGLIYKRGSNKPFTGLGISYYEDDQKQSEGNYKNGKLDGPWTEWYEYGKKESEGNYKDGIKEGPWIQWTHITKTEENYKNGRLDGLWTEYWISQSNASIYQDELVKDHEGYYKEGYREGLWTWYRDKQKEKEVNYTNGLCTTWHENGEKRSEGNLKFMNGLEEGFQEGLWTSWYENGQKEEEGNYKDHYKEGLWTSWDENGKKKSEASYERGEVLDSPSIRFLKNNLSNLSYLLLVLVVIGVIIQSTRRITIGAVIGFIIGAIFGLMAELSALGNAISSGEGLNKISNGLNHDGGSIIALVVPLFTIIGGFIGFATKKSLNDAGKKNHSPTPRNI